MSIGVLPIPRGMEANTELMNALQTLLEIGKYSDLTVVCGTKTWAVHRAIICSRSGFFDGACSSRFREAQTGIIDLSADDPEAVEHMINYFYKLDYLPGAPSFPGSPAITSPTSSFFPSRVPKKLNLAFVEDPLLATAAAHAPIAPQDPPTRPAPQVSIPTHASPFTSPITSPGPHMTDFSSSFKAPQSPTPEDELEASTWDVRSTASGCDDINVCEPQLVTHAKVYAIAEKYQIMGLKTLARRKFAMQVAHHYTSEEFPDALAEVYESTVGSDRGLRDVVIMTFRKHPEIARRRDIEDVVKETPALAWELFRVGWGLPIQTS